MIFKKSIFTSDFVKWNGECSWFISASDCGCWKKLLYGNDHLLFQFLYIAEYIIVLLFLFAFDKES